MKHLAGIIAFFFLITLVHKDDHSNLAQLWILTIFTYSLFFLSTRMKIYYSIALILLLLIHENYKTYIKDKEDKHEILKMIKICIIAVAAVGVTHYLFRQYNDFKGNFSIMKFFVGTTTCKGLR